MTHTYTSTFTISWMISPDHDKAKYVQVVIIKRETRKADDYRICVLLNMLIKIGFYKIMGRNAVQVPMTNGKIIVQITPWVGISLNIST